MASTMKFTVIALAASKFTSAFETNRTIGSSSDPFYDHQTKTYDAIFDPVTISGNIAFAPYFSPDHSVDTTVDLINSAVSTLDIAIPSISSWVYECAGYVDDDVSTCAPGCTPSEQRDETFPAFPAILNALHRGVKVRLMTNDYNTPDCEGTITQLQFLALNGADVRYFTTTTFVHAKYQSTDGILASVSSINWSKASMTENREAGVLISGDLSDEGAKLLSYMTSVFESDFNQAYALVPGTWSKEDLSVIQDTSILPITIPDINLPDGMYITPKPELVLDDSTSTIQASPDSAWDTIEANLNSAKKSIEIAMYQVTTDDLCSQIIDMQNNGINVTLMVSSLIYDSYDCSLAKKCYASLYAGGVKFRKTSTNYEYSHNKYWIIDNSIASWSTGNWSPSDYPINHSNTYPPYGQSDWWDSNRDFTGYTTSSNVVNSFSTVFVNDWYAPEASDWSPDNDIYCGY